MSRTAKTEIVSYRTTPRTRRRLGALAKRQFKKAGINVNTRNRDHVSLFMNQVTSALIEGRIQIKPGLLTPAR